MTFEEAQSIVAPLCNTKVTVEYSDDSIRTCNLVGFSTDERGDILACVRLPNSAYISRFHPSRVKELNQKLKSQPINNINDARNHVVYVVTAINESDIKEQRVFASLFEADEIFRELCKEFGGGNVCLTSRRVL